MNSATTVSSISIPSPGGLRYLNFSVVNFEYLSFSEFLDEWTRLLFVLHEVTVGRRRGELDRRCRVDCRTPVVRNPTSIERVRELYDILGMGEAAGLADIQLEEIHFAVDDGSLEILDSTVTFPGGYRDGRYGS